MWTGGLGKAWDGSSELPIGEAKRLFEVDVFDDDAHPLLAIIFETGVCVCVGVYNGFVSPSF